MVEDPFGLGKTRGHGLPQGAGQGHLRGQDHGRTPGFQTARGQFQVDPGLAAAGDPVHEHGAALGRVQGRVQDFRAAACSAVASGSSGSTAQARACSSKGRVLVLAGVRNAHQPGHGQGLGQARGVRPQRLAQGLQVLRPFGQQVIQEFDALSA